MVKIGNILSKNYVNCRGAGKVFETKPVRGPVRIFNREKGVMCRGAA